jgi:hypothetical protein
MSSNESTTHIPITAHYYVNSKETAEHANNDLIRRIQLRGGGRF